MTVQEYEAQVQLQRASLVRYASRMVGSADAEDCVQQAFLSVWLVAETLDPERAPAYFQQAVKSKCVRMQTREGLAKDAGFSYRPPPGEPLTLDGRDGAARPDVVAELRIEWAKLPEEARGVVAIRGDGGCEEDVRRFLGLSERKFQRQKKQGRLLGGRHG